jgi:hypothetical protein
LQAGLDVGDGLGSFLKEDGMDAKRTSLGHGLLDVVEEDDLFRACISVSTSVSSTPPRSKTTARIAIAAFLSS